MRGNLGSVRQVLHDVAEDADSTDSEAEERTRALASKHKLFRVLGAEEAEVCGVFHPLLLNPRLVSKSRAQQHQQELVSPIALQTRRCPHDDDEEDGDAHTWAKPSKAKTAWLTGFTEEERHLVEAGNGPSHETEQSQEQWRGIRLRREANWTDVPGKLLSAIQRRGSWGGSSSPAAPGTSRMSLLCGGRASTGGAHGWGMGGGAGSFCGSRGRYISSSP